MSQLNVTYAYLTVRIINNLIKWNKNLKFFAGTVFAKADFAEKEFAETAGNQIIT